MDQRDARMVFLERVLDATRILMTLTGRLNRKSRLKASHTVDLLKHQLGYVLEEFVEVELESGSTLSYSLALTWPHDRWHIEAKLQVHRGHEAELLRLIFDRDVDPDDVEAALVRVAEDIRESAESADLESLASAPAID